MSAAWGYHGSGGSKHCGMGHHLPRKKSRYAQSRWGAVAGVGLAFLSPKQARAGDPYLSWHTVKSPHFRVHYAEGLEDIAQRTASSGESVYERLVPQLGW